MRNLSIDFFDLTLTFDFVHEIETFIFLSALLVLHIYRPCCTSVDLPEPVDLADPGLHNSSGLNSII